MDKDTFLQRVVVQPNGCWYYTFKARSHGYPVLSDEGVKVLCTHWAYQEWVGPIYDDMVLDHVVCDDRECVNPWHVQPTTRGENSRRAYAKQTHCRNGHEFTPDNTYIQTHSDGTKNRKCRTCHRAQMKKYRTKHD